MPPDQILFYEFSLCISLIVDIKVDINMYEINCRYSLCA